MYSNVAKKTKVQKHKMDPKNKNIFALCGSSRASFVLHKKFALSVAVMATFFAFLVSTILLPLLPQTEKLTPKAHAASTSSTLNFQARLLTPSGSLVPDGYYNIRFKLYDGGTQGGPAGQGQANAGTQLWSEEHKDTNGASPGQDYRVRVVNGYFSVYLGSQTAFPSINWDQELWLTMDIGGTTQTATPTYDGEMLSTSPAPNSRIKLSAVPYAFKAGQLAKTTGSYNSTLDFATQTASRSILLPDESGTICIQGSASCGFALSGSGSFIQNGTSLQTTANFNIQSAGASSVGGVIRGATSQTADLFQLQDSAGTVLTAFSSSGQLIFGGDTNLYRSGVDTLKTDDSFAVGSNVSISSGGNITQTGATTLSTGTGSVSLNGNTTVKPSSNNANAFRVRDISDNNVLQVSTANGNKSVQVGQGGIDSAFRVVDTTSSAIFDVDTAFSTVAIMTGASLVNVSSSQIYLGGSDIDFGSSIAFMSGSDFSTTGVSNNVNFSEVSLVRLTGASVQTITGIANGRDGEMLTIVNAASQAATISNNSGSSIATNRIITGTGADITLNAGASITLIYDAGASLWRTTGSVAFSTGNFIQNGTSPQTADFNITGNGVIGGTLTVAGLLTANGNLTLQTGDTFTINGDALTDLTGSGLINSSGALTVDATSATGFFRNGGNSFGGSATLGTNDYQSLFIKTNGIDRFQFQAGGAYLTGHGATIIDSTGSLHFGLSSTIANGLSIGSSGTTGGTLRLGDAGVASTIQMGNTTGAVTQTVNIGNNSTAGSTNDVNIGSSVAGTTAITGTTTVTGRTTGSATALTVNNSTSTGNIFVAQDNGTAVFTIADGGASTFTGAVSVNGGAIDSTATTFNLLQSAVTTLNIGDAVGAGGINLAGGSGSTGCTIDGSNGNLTCSGNIVSSGTSGAQGWWSRSGTVLQPSNAGDDITTSGKISMTGTNDSAKLRVSDNSGNSIFNVSTTGGGVTIGGNAPVFPNFSVRANSITFFNISTISNTLTSKLDTVDFQDQYGTSQLSIDAGTGAVGIGLAPGAASYKLDVAGAINSSTAYYLNGSNINTAGTLTNVAYLNASSQTFTGNNTIGGTLTVSGLLAANGNITLQTGDTFTINGDALTDLTGDGLTLSGGALTVDATSATGFFRNGGNSFGGAATLGTNDANVLNLETNNANRFQISSSASTMTGQGATTYTSTGATTVSSAAASALNLTSGTTGAVTLDSGTTGAVNIGNNANAKTVTIGNSTGATSVAVNCGTGACNFGTNATAHTTNIGSTTGASTLNLQAGTGGVNIATGGAANTVQIGNTTGAVTQTINIGNNSTAGSTNNVNIGSGVAGTTAITGATTITNRTSGSADTLIISNSTSTGNILQARDNATAVLTIADGGATTFSNQTNSTTAFRIQNASAQNLFVADTTNQRVAIGPASVPANSVLTIGTDTTTASGGITFGTDTAFYRYAQDVLATDGSFFANGGNFFATTAYTGLTFSTATNSGIYNTGANGAGYIAIDNGTAGVPVIAIAQGGATTFKNNTDSVAAFQIQSSSSTVLLNADTTNMRITIGGATGSLAGRALEVTSVDVTTTLRVGDGTNGISFNDQTSGKLRFRGTAQNDISVTLSPEYAGAVLTGDGSNNTGTMTSDFCSGSSLLNIGTSCGASEDHNFYAWTANATNDYDIYVKWKVPSDFASFASTPVQFYGWKTGGSDAVQMRVYKSGSSTVCDNDSLGSNGSWALTNSVPTTNCTINPGDELVFRMTVSVATNGNYARVGEIFINYKSQF